METPDSNPPSNFHPKAQARESDEALSANKPEDPAGNPENGPGFKASIGFIVLGALILCIRAFYNRFPLFYSDSGTHLRSGFEDFVPVDRPILYGYFLRHVSLSESLWLPIFAQGLLLATGLWLLFKYFWRPGGKVASINRERPSGMPPLSAGKAPAGKELYRQLFSPKSLPVFFLGTTLALSFFSGASLNVCQLNTDIFTPLMFIGLALLILPPKIDLRDLIFSGILIVGSLGMHNSHYLICLGTLFVLTIFMGIRAFRRNRRRGSGKKEKGDISNKNGEISKGGNEGKQQGDSKNPEKGLLYPPFKTNWARIGIAWGCWVAAFLIFSVIQSSYDHVFKPTRGSEIFLTSKLVDMGLVHAYLEENCEKEDFNLCNYLDQSWGDFTWDMENSPLYKTGGWGPNREEYGRLNRKILTTPKHTKTFLARIIPNTIAQLFNFETGDAPPLRQDSSPYGFMRIHMKDQLSEYMGSRQNLGRLDWKFTNHAQNFWVYGSLAVLLFLLFFPGMRQRVTPLQWALIGFFFLAMLMNAGVFGTFSIVQPKYQARLVWLLPVWVVLVSDVFAGFSAVLPLRSGIRK